MRVCIVWGLAMALALHASAEESGGNRWLDHFAFRPPERSAGGICAGTIGDLPSFGVQSEFAGPQLVRVSLPFAAGALPQDLGVAVHCGGELIEPDFHILTLHPGTPASVRRAIVTFPFDFADASFQKFKLQLRSKKPAAVSDLALENQAASTVSVGAGRIKLDSNSVSFSFDELTTWTAIPIAPNCVQPGPAKLEIIERGRHYVWARLLCPDPVWPRILDVRMDSLGGISVQIQIQRLEAGDATGPDVGWEIRGPQIRPSDVHSFAEGATITLRTADAKHEVEFPLAAGYRRGNVAANQSIRYLRCTADEKVPFQESAWRSAEFIVKPVGQAPRNELFQPKLRIAIEPGNFAELHSAGMAEDVSIWPVLAALNDYTRDAIAQSMHRGDDFGNVTSFGDGSAEGPAYGMNRLNHAPAIFEEGWRSGDRRLLNVGALWCLNMHDLSVWWGETKGFGGTRYNNATAAGQKDHEGDANFMWRTNGDSNFCTKGYDTFFYGYEETGDPRMLAALRAQLDYAKEHVHCDQGECRNIGDAADFMRLYRATGFEEYRIEALRLFGELRTKLSTGDLFDQGGKPISSDPPFINSDADGYNVGYAKPYIIGYALAGLPDLLRDFPDEPKLRECVRAVADFLAESVDPVGGWRYPHPRSGYLIVNQGIEHAMQICRAAKALEERGEPIDNLLDAVETVLQARIVTYQKTGRILAGLGAWEETAGMLKDGKTLKDLYQKPGDRDRTRDYTEGAIGLGGSAPEGIVYFGQVLDFYLKHRPAERLLHPNPQLKAVLDRLTASAANQTAFPAMDRMNVLDHGMKMGRPVFTDARAHRMTFPLGWDQADVDFQVWRAEARSALLDSFLEPPSRASFDPEIISVEDRGSYEARKIAFNVSADNRVGGYLLVPKGDGPFPSILALHDHGAHFSIGKEKVVRPFGVSEERAKDAQAWVTASYGGRFIGDELAARGYVVFATDALFWGDRGRAEGVKYEAQEQLAANLFQLGQSWAGVIAWDDLRSATFLQSLPEVDPSRIGCIGLSMGASRAWHLAAATDIVKAGAAICWLGNTQALMAEGNNQTRGQSAFSMIHPGLRNALDYPDVASIACPKPMLFFNGADDGLFPVDGVERAYDTMRGVWQDQHAGANLVTRIWPVPHVFSVEMQEEAFAWLDAHLKPAPEN